MYTYRYRLTNCTICSCTYIYIIQSVNWHVTSIYDIKLKSCLSIHVCTCYNDKSVACASINIGVHQNNSHVLWYKNVHFTSFRQLLFCNRRSQRQSCQSKQLIHTQVQWPGIVCHLSHSVYINNKAKKSNTRFYLLQQSRQQDLISGCVC